MRPRVHYRTLQERHTNTHKSPWLARGYLLIEEDGTITPRFIEPGMEDRLIPNMIEAGGAMISAPYVLA